MQKTLVVTMLALGLSGAPASFAASTTLAGTVRDFVPGSLVPGGSNPDFEVGGSGVVGGMVATTLTGSAPTPMAFGAPGYITSAASFAEWFGAAAPSRPHSITLDETVAGSGVFVYDSDSFFPIDGELLGNYAFGHNYHFTYQIAATFGYTPGAGQTFSFVGDDDVWVFFDKKLGVDLGGVHGPAGASVDMDALLAGYVAGTYSFDFFFAERQTTGSNLRIETSLGLTSPPVPEPQTYAFMALGLACVALSVRRRRS